jgi:hypothetical protein
MASDTGDAEIRSLEQVIEALEPLDAAARSRVLDYAFKRLGINGIEPAPVVGDPQLEAPSSIKELEAKTEGPADIRSLREEKQPKSANEMAAVVGYYLAEVAPAGERKTEIGTADIEKYFKQAQHRLPEAPSKTLRNAAAAGYFDSVERGLYTLNPVGHNLVAHSLPRAASSPPARKRRSNKSKGKTTRKAKSKSKASPKRSKRSA